MIAPPPKARSPSRSYNSPRATKGCRWKPCATTCDDLSGNAGLEFSVRINRGFGRRRALFPHRVSPTPRVVLQKKCASDHRKGSAQSFDGPPADRYLGSGFPHPSRFFQHRPQYERGKLIRSDLREFRSGKRPRRCCRVGLPGSLQSKRESSCVCSHHLHRSELQRRYHPC